MSISLLAFFMGFMLSHIMTEVIRSAVTTTFVCLAEDPSCLSRNDPAFYSEIVRAYPELEVFYSI
jgi:hypothetical protein